MSTLASGLLRSLHLYRPLNFGIYTHTRTLDYVATRARVSWARAGDATSPCHRAADGRGLYEARPRALYGNREQSSSKWRRKSTGGSQPRAKREREREHRSTQPRVVCTLSECQRGGSSTASPRRLLLLRSVRSGIRIFASLTLLSRGGGEAARVRFFWARAIRGREASLREDRRAREVESDFLV